MSRTLRNELQMLKTRHYSSEDALQERVARFLNALQDHKLLLWTHPAPNVYRRGLAAKSGIAARLGQKGKSMGVHAGVPDCVIFSHRVAIELKFKRGVMSPEQIKWFEEAQSWGWHCYRCKTPKEVIEVLKIEGIYPVPGVL